MDYGALFPYRAIGAAIAAAIDVGFVSILNGVRATETPIRFGIAEQSSAAVAVQKAFDALAFAVTSIAAIDVALGSLNRRRIHRRATYADGIETRRRGLVGIVVDRLVAAHSVALYLLAIVRNLRLQRQTVGRRRLPANAVHVARPRQTPSPVAAFIGGRATAAFTRHGANQGAVPAATEARGDDVRIGLPLASFERAGIAIIGGLDAEAF